MSKISVIIPVFNVEKYLSRCLDSLLCQTFGDFEVILIDDHSPDNSLEICYEYAKKDGRIQVYQTEKNGGASVSRNVGLKASKSEYISFVDSDDYLEPNYLQTLLDGLEESGADICQCNFIEVVGGVVGERKEKTSPKTLTGEQAFASMYGGENLNAINFLLWNKIYKKQVIGDLLFVERLRCEDAIFISQVMVKAKKVAVISDQLYYYYRHSDSVMGKMDADVKDLIKSHILAYRIVAKSVQNESGYVQTLSIARLASFYVSAIKNKMLKKDKELKRLLKEDKKQFKFRKNKKIPFIKRLVISLWG